MPDFKVEVALNAHQEPAARYQVATAQITRRKLQLRQQAAQVFTKKLVPGAAVADVETLYAAISRLQMENALLKTHWG